MCGIGGIVAKEPQDLSIIYQMMKVQSHRGQDGEGYLFGEDRKYLLNPESKKGLFGRWGLGHKRLNIIDRSIQGNQPLSYHNQSYWITYNGELYNYLELKAELSVKGLSFSTKTDTEVILAAYQLWGTECFKKFNGMWALVIVDLEKRKIIFSRDRFGEKPLHYYKDNTKIVFSSEIKGILQSLEKKNLKCNHEVMSDYLRWGMVNHTDDTFFSGIKSFPAGSFAEVNLNYHGENFIFNQYWDLKKIDKVDVSYEQAKNKFKELFLSSVALRKQTEVPMGYCLSGGLDSASIVCAARHLSENTLETFSYIPSVSKYSEEKWSSIVNETTQANKNYFFINENDFSRDLDDLLWHQEEPFTNTSIYAQWSLMSYAKKKNITVLLCGQGADELLCGYRKFYFFNLLYLLKNKKFSDFLIESLFLMLKNKNTFRLDEGIRYLPSYLRKWYLTKNDLFSNPFNEKFSSNKFKNDAEDLTKRQIADLAKYSLPSLLRYEDRNAMAWSIESRVPFLDHRLVEFTLGLPSDYKLKYGKTKRILRHAFIDFVPKEILTRSDKMGFVTPQADWVKNALGLAILKNLKSQDSMVGRWLNLPKLEYMFSRRRGLDQIFRIYILDKWMQRFEVLA